MKEKNRNAKTVLLFILLASRVMAYGQNNFSTGAGIEANIITLDNPGFSLGGLLNADYRFIPNFAAGISVGMGFDLKDMISAESRIFGRWYIFRPAILEFFLQADAGLLMTIRNGNYQESRGSPSIGLTLGTRILLPHNWYLEPYIRGGYPFKGAIGLLAGISLGGNKNEQANRNRLSGGDELLDRKSGEELIIRREISTVPEIAALAIEPYIYFASNTANFSGLDATTVKNNGNLLKELASFMNHNTEYQLVIEGHANPVENTKNEEEMSLNPLSIKRAEVVANTLISSGIERKRLIIAGSGGTKTVASWTDREHWNLNRRVEFMLIRYVEHTQ
ncbi:MAG: OmpA family protein [Spirochaetaceae bacterium]|jgi:outer membrane protein OmpA-like peptidoglycan-associated protein|nr:OmpA family protein [Spirochaetaceae bacterium]